MKVLRKSKPFYKTALKHFQKQYKDVSELTLLKVTSENQICAGEWINSKGENCISDSIDAVSTIKIIE